MARIQTMWLYSLPYHPEKIQHRTDFGCDNKKAEACPASLAWALKNHFTKQNKISDISGFTLVYLFQLEISNVRIVC